MTAPRDGLEGPRLLAHPLAQAVVEVTSERGYELADVAAFTRRARVPEVEFHRHFTGKPDAVLRVLEATIADFRTRVGAAYEAGGEWPDSLRAAAYEAVRRLLRDPGRTWFAIVSTAPGEEMARARRDELYLWGASLIDDGRALAAHPEAVPRCAGILAIGAVVEELRRRHERRPRDDLVAALPRTMYAAVRPYLGEEAARRELELPPPPDLRWRGSR